MNVAIKNLVDSRAKEGQKIEKIVLAKTLFLKNAHQKLFKSAPSLLKHRVKTIKNKFIQKNININQDEIANELSSIELKHDIAEELERISFHIESLNKLFKLKNAHGKKMDFILT